MTENSTNGIIYILSNPYMPGLVKIGFTGRNAVARAGELSQATGVPAAFEVVFFHRCQPDSECLVHKALEIHRINSKREFFALSPAAAISLVSSLLGIKITQSQSFEIPNNLFDMTFDNSDLQDDLFWHTSLDRSNKVFEEGQQDGREWPETAEKWRLDFVLKFEKPAAFDDRSFLYHMKNVFDSDLKRPENADYVAGFFYGVRERFEWEEQKRSERDYE